jgi:hypothetical protein
VRKIKETQRKWLNKQRKAKNKLIQKKKEENDKGQRKIKQQKINEPEEQKWQ